MFFQTSAETVGITKNGAITRIRTTPLAPHRLIQQQRQQYAQNHGDDQDTANDDAGWFARGGQNELDDTKRT